MKGFQVDFFFASLGWLGSVLKLITCLWHPKQSIAPKQAIWVFPKIGISQNGWFVMEHPIKMDDLGGTGIFGNTHIVN